MQKRPLTPTYIIFYIVFLADTWQILMGLGLAAIFLPFAVKPETGIISRVLIFIMLATIGYVVTRIPARWITKKIKIFILGDGNR